jgi:hypothetical protein
MGNDRLSGWKEIAAFFRVCRNTVMKWHRNHPMPIRKLERVIVTTKKELRRWEKVTMGYNVL